MLRTVLKLLKRLAVAVVLIVVLGLGWVYVSPPALFLVGSGYSAKIVCSNVFVAGRDAAEVLNDDVQAPGHPLLRLMRVDVDQENRMVTAGLLGVFGKSIAVWREGLGCTSVPDGDVELARDTELAPENGTPIADGEWPSGNSVTGSVTAVESVLSDDSLTGPGMRAVVVVKDGRIVGERYGSGFSSDTPLIGWSMTKTVNAAIIGTLVAEGKMDLNKAGLFPEWEGDGRSKINVADLMAMSSGLSFNEDYGDVTDVTRMLFLEPDMQKFATSLPLKGEVGKVWSYSSGTSVILSELWEQAAAEEALAWPRNHIFSPLGMTSAVYEADETGTYVGSSYLYATARDWARFGQFLLQDGVWNDKQILPQGFVAWMREEAPASNGAYGRGQLWLKGPAGGGEKDAASSEPLPSDTYWMTGHDGQTAAIIPSKGIVVVRLGLTPSKLGYRPQQMVARLVKALN